MKNKVSQWVNCTEKPLDINDFNHRPLLKNQDPAKILSELQESRLSFYEKVADYIIDTENKSGSEVANEIIKLTKN